MASPEVLDFPRLLAPIPGDRPTGSDLRADTSPAAPFHALKAARAGIRAAERKRDEGDEIAREAPIPDWQPVLQQARQLLSEKTKDLEITTFLIEALLREHGYAGLRDGFRLAHDLIERYWGDNLFPLADEEGVATRVAGLTGLNGLGNDGALIAPLFRVPITEASRFTAAQYKEAVAVARISDAKAREKRMERGKIASLDTIRKAAGESSAGFYNNLTQDLTACVEQYRRLCSLLDQRCGKDAPPSSNIRNALDAVLTMVGDLAREATQTTESPTAPASAQPTHTDKAGPTAEASGEILTREDAFRSLLKVAEFFRRTEPHTIVSYALEQVVRWGRMPLPELLSELIPDEAPRKNLFKMTGIRPPEPPAKPDAKK